LLHIATVHFGSPRWIEIQTRYLREHISTPYQTWTSLEGIDSAYAVHFDRVIDQGGRHAGKLNNLAMEISHQAADDDLIMFLDGDAFPIADPMPLIERNLAQAPLTAVRRAENGGDQQPHPCFCVTTVKTWREVHGDWSPGHQWVLPDGRRPTDVGGNLLRALELTRTPWVDILRSNRPDPLMFAIYGETIYHHGAGFRRGGTARDAMPKRLWPTPRSPILRKLTLQIEAARLLPWRLTTRVPQKREAQRIFEMIERGDPDWLKVVS
jgi:hypothetical protein